MTQYVFFSGKGGVGKTSLACTHAVRYADQGKRTLIVTTDPASNLADVFEQEIGHKIGPIRSVPNLAAMEIDPDRSTREYIEAAMAPIRTAFPPQMVQVMEEQMSGPCTAEVAAFDRFTDFLEAPGGNGSSYEVVIFDTAPTGHTIRLLQLPAEWTQSIEAATAGSGQTCIGPAAAIQEAKQKYDRALAALRDRSRSTFVFVLHPEAIAIRETRRAIGELERLGIRSFRLIVNGIVQPEPGQDPLFAARARMHAGYLREIEQRFAVPQQRLRLLPCEVKGVERLRQVASVFFDGQSVSVEPATTVEGDFTHAFASAAPDVRSRIEPDGQRRTLFFAGKGGVGKTVASCVTAVWLAQQGHKTLLLTTDPAAHIGDVLDTPVGDEIGPVDGQSGLWAVRIDPKAAAAAYRARILDDARLRGRPESAIAVMEEELNSPCTEEMAAFDRFIEYASQEQWDAVVFDTAPTGHTLRLLELPMDWSKQIDVKIFASVDTTAADDVAKKRFAQVIDMMRDPKRSTFAFVLYPEATPILEAWRATQELATVGVHAGLIVANLVIPSDQATTPFARARRAMQEKYLSQIAERFGLPMVRIPLLEREVKGVRMLAELAGQLYGTKVVA